MEITAIVHTHGNPELTWDTVDSVKHYMTDQVVVLVDEAGWNQFDLKTAPANMLKGFYHGYFKAPYRNIIMGLLAAAQNWPNSEWYAYLEFDSLIGSSAFKTDLELATKQNVWLIGNDYRDKQTVRFPLVEMMLKTKFEEIVYLLGAVLFYHKNFIKKCMEENFFEKFLYYTNDFKNGFFPGYEQAIISPSVQNGYVHRSMSRREPSAWDLIEHMMPTLAKHWGGEVQQFAKWNQSGVWAGNYRRYPIRWQPELFLVDHEYLQASIMHPLKSFSHPIREFHRNKRNRKK